MKYILIRVINENGTQWYCKATASVFNHREMIIRHGIKGNLVIITDNLEESCRAYDLDAEFDILYADDGEQLKLMQMA